MIKIQILVAPFEFEVEGIESYKPFGELSAIVAVAGFERLVAEGKSYKNLSELHDVYPCNVVEAMIDAMNQHLQDEANQNSYWNKKSRKDRE